MRVQAVHFRNFRGLAETQLQSCGDFNVLIGRNNAGKSSVLSAIELAISHLRGGRVATRWITNGRPTDEFTNRETRLGLQIAVELHISSDFNEKLRGQIRAETIGLEVAVDQLTGIDVMFVILGCAIIEKTPVCFLAELGLGKITTKSAETLSINGKTLFAMTPPVASEIVRRESMVEGLRRDVAALEDFAEPTRIEYMLRDSAERDPRTLTRRIRDQVSAPIAMRLDEGIRDHPGRHDSGTIISLIQSVIHSVENNIRAKEQEQTVDVMTCFSGSVRTVPAYVEWAMTTVAEDELLHLKEERAGIGPDEAARLLRFKTRRGSTQHMSRLQETVTLSARRSTGCL